MDCHASHNHTVIAWLIKAGALHLEPQTEAWIKKASSRPVPISWRGMSG